MAAHTAEPAFNALMALALDQRHPRWDVHAEQVGVLRGDPGKQLDIVITPQGRAGEPVVIETEYQPATFVVIDHEVILVTSANFSYSAENRNVEFGLLVHDSGLACISRDHDGLQARHSLRARAITRLGRVVVCRPPGRVRGDRSISCDQGQWHDRVLSGRHSGVRLSRDPTTNPMALMRRFA